MIFMFCNYCGAPNPDDGKFCSQCGKPLSPMKSSEPQFSSTPMHTIEIFRESQTFLINPPINVSVNGRNNFSVANGETRKIELAEGNYEFVFSQSMRKRIVNINLDRDIFIKLKWNRITGSIEVNVSK